MTALHDTLRSSLFVLAAATIGACATAPRQQFTDAQATARAAEAVGAEEHPRASYHLKLANEQLAVAEPLVDGSNRDRKTAKKILARAAADAQLAMTLAQTAELHEKARQTWTEVEELRQEQ